MHQQLYKTHSTEQTDLAWGPTSDRRFVVIKDLASKLLREIRTIEPSEDVIRLGDGFRLDDRIRKVEVELIRHALLIAGGRQRTAAALLGIKPTTLNMKIKRFGIDVLALTGARDII